MLPVEKIFSYRMATALSMRFFDPHGPQTSAVAAVGRAAMGYSVAQWAARRDAPLSVQRHLVAGRPSTEVMVAASDINGRC
jgi:hypothetical protein